MCGACGEGETGDWARALHASPAARSAVATAAIRLTARPGVTVTVRPGGWLVRHPTGSSAACATLTDLVARLRSATGPGVPSAPASHASGPLSVPGPDARTGVRVRVLPGAADTTGTPDELWTVPTQRHALTALALLAGPPWSLRRYLAGLTGVTAPWGLPARPAHFRTPDQAADLVVWAEWARQAGSFDTTPFTARCSLDGTTHLDLEIRAGHVVRAVGIPAPPARPR